MVHLCNLKMSAASTRLKSKGRHYDIDDFISQLLASRMFDDLAEKFAEKAANKIMHIDAAPSPVERATDGNESDNSTESTQDANQTQSNREDVIKKYEKTQSNNVELRKDFTGKIDPLAVMNATISLSENLQLKYKYFKKNAFDKKVKSNRDRHLKNDTKEDQSKLNKTAGLAEFKDRSNKTQERISNQNATKEKQMFDEKESIDENKCSRDDTKNDDSNRKIELNESCHSGTDGETNDSSKKPHHSLEGQDPGQTVSREAQHSDRPEDKAIVELEVSHVDNGTREEKASSLEKDIHKHLTRYEANTIEEVEKTEGVAEKRSTDEINEGENVIAQFRAHEDSFEENKVTPDYNSHGAVYRSKASDDSDGRSPEERSPEDQSSKEQSAGEDPNSSKLKPVIRKEGDKLYTYVRAPEYEDYHEKLAKWQKEHPDNPADFM